MREALLWRADAGGRLVAGVAGAAGRVQMLGWAALFVGYGMYLLLNRGHWLAKSVGVVLPCWAWRNWWAWSAAAAIRWRRWPTWAARRTKPLAFQRIKTVQQLDAVLAQTGGKTVMLDFYADWCVSCKEMEKLTFVDPPCARAGQHRAAAGGRDRQRCRRQGHAETLWPVRPAGHHPVRPQGKEIANARVIGFQDAAKFTASLSALN
jgi:thiol:disulfide interchange protein DsbD